MLTEKDAQELLVKYSELKKAYDDKPSALNKKKLDDHKSICISKFNYLVLMKTARYKSFSNYDDLTQEAFLGLIYAMDSYNVNKGSAFWWIHKYLDTRIVRSANNHCTIRFPMRVAKDQTPHKQSIMPNVIDDGCGPEIYAQNMQLADGLNSSFEKLPSEQQDILCMAYGIGNYDRLSIQEICETKNITRSRCVKLLRSAIKGIRANLNL